MVTTNSYKYYKNLLLLRNHGLIDRDTVKIAGYNSRLDTIQAAILNVKLNHFEKELIRKVEIKQLYHVGLCDLKSVELPDESEFTSHVWHQYTIKVSENIRDKLQMYLGNKGVSSIVYYPHILADQLAYQDMIERTALSNSRALSAQVLSLPIDPSMSNSDVNFICKSIIALVTACPITKPCCVSPSSIIPRVIAASISFLFRRRSRAKGISIDPGTHTISDISQFLESA